MRDRKGPARRGDRDRRNQQRRPRVQWPASLRAFLLLWRRHVRSFPSSLPHPPRSRCKRPRSKANVSQQRLPSQKPSAGSARLLILGAARHLSRRPPLRAHPVRMPASYRTVLLSYMKMSICTAKTMLSRLFARHRGTRRGSNAQWDLLLRQQNPSGGLVRGGRFRGRG